MRKALILFVIVYLICGAVAAQEDAVITLDNASEISQLTSLSTERAWINDLVFSFNDELLAVVETGDPAQNFADAQGLVRIWNTATWEQALLIAHEDTSATTVGFNHASIFVAIGTTSGEIYRWYLPDNLPSDSFTAHSSMINKISTQQGWSLLSSSGGVSTDGMIQHGTVDTRSFFDQETYQIIIHEADEFGVISWIDSNSMNNTYVTASMTNKVAYLWFVEPLVIIARLPGYGPAKPVLFTPDSQQVLYGSIAGVMVWHDIVGVLRYPDHILESRVIAPVGLDRTITEIALNPTGDVLAVGYENGEIWFWALESGEKLHQVTGHEGQISRLVFNTSGTLLASSGADGLVHIWCVPTAAHP